VVPVLAGLGYAYLPGDGAKRALLQRVMNRLYARAFAASHGVIFHNGDDAQVLADAGIVPDALPVTVVRGSGVDPAHYAEQPLPARDNGVTFLMIARLVRYKGVAEYCEAARLCRARGHEARWLLVGPAETGPAAFPPEEIARYADAVTWLGSSDDVRTYLRDAHVYVLPSYGEGMPRTVLEALATGRPVITTDARGCRETVREGVNGHLVPTGDAEALAGAMSEFITRPERIPAMARESRKIAEAEFDVARVNAAMLKALGLEA
jgi:glycosyltransferase involved in cell wall biosynthesis